MARKIKNKRNRYRSRYQLGGLQGVPTNLLKHELSHNVSDTTNVTPIQKFQVANALQRANQMKLIEQKQLQRRGAAGGPQVPKMFQGGGMYTDNTVQAAAQGLQGSTSNIVYQENNPKLQEERLRQMEAEKQRLLQEGNQTKQVIEQTEAEGEVAAQQAAQETQQKFAQGEMAAGALSKAAGMDSAKDLKGAALGNALKAYQGVRAANLGSKLTQAGIAGAKGAKVAGLAAKAGAFPMSSATTGKTILVDAGGNVIKGGSAVGAGLKSFMSSGAGIGTIATLAGAGLKKWAADDDPTTADWGDVGGSALSAAGTGMAIGSMLGPVGTAAGGIIGGLYGAGKSIFGAKKAKKEQQKYDLKIARKKEKYNQELEDTFGSQMSQIRTGELAGKTYSGYDYGRNIMAKLGGMRMGMPRYGYAA